MTLLSYYKLTVLRRVRDVSHRHTVSIHESQTITSLSFNFFPVQSSFFEKHLKMLINEAEHKVEDLTLSVVHATNSNSSEIKVRRLQSSLLCHFLVFYSHFISICLSFCPACLNLPSKSHCAWISFQETERQLKEWEWTRLTLRRMLIGLNNSGKCFDILRQ